MEVDTDISEEHAATIFRVFKCVKFCNNLGYRLVIQGGRVLGPRKVVKDGNSVPASGNRWTKWTENDSYKGSLVYHQPIFT
jgi:hypothetical protein